jgi:uncharacterized membrane protein SirB2
MMLGLSLANFTLLHTAISLIGIATGLVVLYGLLANGRLHSWNTAFLVSTVLTSVTGFMFPFTQWLPSHTFGVVSLLALGFAIAALYRHRLAGKWRVIYLSGVLFALYLNCFVLVVQTFLKVPGVKTLAPTQTEPPFLTAQFLLLVLFIVFGVIAGMRFRPQPAM